MLSGRIPLKDGKVIHFDPNHDTILVLTLADYRMLPCLPGQNQLGSTRPDYKSLFKDVKHLLLSFNSIEDLAGKVASSNRLLSHFTALENLSWSFICIEDFENAKKNNCSIRLVSFEEHYSATLDSCELYLEGISATERLVQRCVESLTKVEEGVETLDLKDLKVSLYLLRSTEDCLF